MNDQGVDLAGPKEAEPIKKTRVRKSKLVIASPSGEEVSLKHIAKHFRDTLELHHKESMVVDEKGDRHWTIDLESPLSLWFKEGDTYREDVKAIQPGPD